MFRRLLLAFLLLVPAAAQAEWRRAESAHFIVYGDLKAEELRAQTATLEKYFFVLRAISGREIQDTPVKIRIYLVASTLQVRQTMAFDSEGVAGYYNPALRGPYLVTPALGRGTSRVGMLRTTVEKGLDHNLVAFHELAHHFMFQNFTATYPTWYSEGFADFYGTFKIDEQPDTDRVEIGRSHEWRIEQILHTPWLPMEKLLTARSYADVGDAIGNLYAEGWLLIHYAANNPARGAQLKLYLAEIGKGKTYAEAARTAFGDSLRELDRELQRYAASPRINVYIYPFKKIDPGQIAIRDLTPAEADLWVHDIKLSGGIWYQDAARFQRMVREAAAKYPNDPHALKLLTETELLLEDFAAARAAADRWLAVAPDDPFALTRKAQVLIGQLKAQKAPAGDPRWKDARAGIRKAIGAAPDIPDILKAYYDSFVAEGVLPPAGAQNGLMRALQLLPQNDELRYQVALDFDRRGFTEDAITIIRPLAYEIKPSSEFKPSERARRERAWDKYRLQGEERQPETAREIFDRLVARLEKEKAAAPAS